ncbi:MAG: twin-arginine translocase TatA/TatE family subunit [Bauldia sp.]
MESAKRAGFAAHRDVGVGLMGMTSIWHWLILGAIVLILFGRGKISEVMGDVAKGVKSFKRGLAEDETPAATPRAIDRTGAEAVATAPVRDDQRV